jgi:GT2 family glycosyltransferase
VDPVPSRPPVSVVVPFLGDERELQSLLDRLRRLRLRAGDEVIVADNRTTGAPWPETAPLGPGPAVRLHAAGGVHTPGFARNRGAAVARGEWLVFIDADTDPAPDLLDVYFEPPPAARTGVLGGGIVDVLPVSGGTRPALAARALVARGHMSHATTLERPDFPYAQSANCAVRRSAFLEVGGFDETVRAAEDADLCFRLADRGWGLERRPAATVSHLARASAGAALRQLAGHGAGAAWCNRRHPGSFPPPAPVALGRRLVGAMLRAAAAGARGERERAAFAAFEALEATAFELGRLLSNRARR